MKRVTANVLLLGTTAECFPKCQDLLGEHHTGRGGEDVVLPGKTHHWISGKPRLLGRLEVKALSKTDNLYGRSSSASFVPAKAAGKANK